MIFFSHKCDNLILSDAGDWLWSKWLYVWWEREMCRIQRVSPGRGLSCLWDITSPSLYTKRNIKRVVGFSSLYVSEDESAQTLRLVSWGQQALCRVPGAWQSAPSAYLDSAGKHPINHSLITEGQGSRCSNNSEAMLWWWCKLCSPILGELRERQSIKMPLRGVHNSPLVSGQAGSCGLCLTTNLMMGSWRITVDYSAHIHFSPSPCGHGDGHTATACQIALSSPVCNSSEYQLGMVSCGSKAKKSVYWGAWSSCRRQGGPVGSKVCWGHLRGVEVTVPLGPGLEVGGLVPDRDTAEAPHCCPKMAASALHPEQGRGQKQTNKKKHVSAISWMQNFLLFYDPNSHLCRRLVPQFVFAEAKLFVALSGPRASSKASGMNAAGFLAQGTPGCFMQFWMLDQKVHICMYLW